MPLAPGTRLGPHEIVALIGAGGMGEVYKAHDTRLGRTVAIKVMKERFHERFEREAKAISSLNHPHVCTLYDIGNHEGLDYLVMEFIDGKPLEGPFPLEDALRYAAQVADGLDAAHRAKVIHRDLKPGNILLSKQGVKLVDFGLAKPPPREAGQNEDTLTAALTQPGTFIGTPHYMSPELFGGTAEPDERSDLWAFGCVLYELVTGKRAFQGKDTPTIIAAVIAGEPQGISTLQPLTPPALEQLVRRCVAKDPEERWQSARDVKHALGYLSPAAPPPQSSPAPEPSRMQRLWPAAAAGALVLGALLGVLYDSLRPAPAPDVAYLEISLPQGTQLAGMFAVSPDGRQLVFRARAGSARPQLWVRALDSPVARALAGTEGAFGPFWSPDSAYVAFFAENKLKKIQASGGPPQVLCDAYVARGGTWGREGVILFSSNARQLMRVPATGGPVAPLEISDGSALRRYPYFLPDGRRFLYQVAGVNQAGVYLASIDGGQARLIASGTDAAIYVPPGYLLFPRAQTLLAQRFDAARGALEGETNPVGEKIGPGPFPGSSLYSASATGLLVYRAGEAEDRQLTWYDRAGRKLGTVSATRAYSTLALSPDGARVAVAQAYAGPSDVWLVDLARGTTSRFTTDAATETHPVWSPDSGRIVFSSTRSGGPDLFSKPSGGGAEELLFKSEFSKYPSDWSADGRFLTFMNLGSNGFDVYALPMQGERKPMPVVATQFDERDGRFAPSPDGHPKWIAYYSDETGESEVYVKPFSGERGSASAGGEVQISTGGGRFPRWRGDGRELYYVTPDNTVMAVEVQNGDRFVAGTPKPLFSAPFASVDASSVYSVTPDGQRFLIITQAQEAYSIPFTVVQNWPALLEKAR